VSVDTTRDLPTSRSWTKDRDYLERRAIMKTSEIKGGVEKGKRRVRVGEEKEANGYVFIKGQRVTKGTSHPLACDVCLIQI